MGWFAWPSKLREAGVLGMNRRNVECILRYNKRSLYPLVDNKLKTKLAAQQAGIAVPELIGVIEHQFQVKGVLTLIGERTQFVIKPVQGSGGKGILVIVGREGDQFIKPSGQRVTYDYLQRHISDTLSGLFSLGGRPDQAMLEALINFDEALSQYSYEGVPDVRVVVYRGYPVMAMIRCATHSSDGKANLHQGAVGVGLNLADGSAICAVQNGEPVDKHPDTGSVFNELKVPLWQDILVLAAGAHEMTGLGYLGADIVLDKIYGPLVLELNARPGLSIQVANQQGLLNRLHRIDEQCLLGPIAIEERVKFSQDAFGKQP
ncbi:alpha-L-glutamate ligase-like protein [Simiduia curdlanivorans]|uniref:Alpha-L-glutamate ligase-like protein n=1 Tax=Simiduia curdlanivorans TaxID=1492769 RepID=A0ABV8V518_9GAMM|nr:alpha-L-glutamate ligase-like protein [Simiduia curdlanivorans]MDN3640849.1 alpha-L-glutamate ligase-like protein [Simiduia curdlanivorans]